MVQSGDREQHRMGNPSEQEFFLAAVLPRLPPGVSEIPGGTWALINLDQFSKAR